MIASIRWYRKRVYRLCFRCAVDVKTSFSFLLKSFFRIRPQNISMLRRAWYTLTQPSFVVSLVILRSSPSRTTGTSRSTNAPPQTTKGIAFIWWGKVCNIVDVTPENRRPKLGRINLGDTFFSFSCIEWAKNYRKNLSSGKTPLGLPWTWIVSEFLVDTYI